MLKLLPVIGVAPLLLFFPQSRWLPLALIVPLSWLISRPRNGWLLPSTPLNFPLSILGLSVLASTLFCPDIEFSLGKLAGSVFGFLLFFSTVEFLGKAARLRLAVLGFAAIGGAFSLLSLTFTGWKPRVPLLQAVAEGLFPVRLSLPGFEEGFNPNPVAGTVLFFFPLLWFLSRRIGKSPDREAAGRFLNPWFFRTALAIAALVLLLTQSRGAWGGLLVSGLFVAVVFLLGTRTGWLARRAPEVLLTLIVFSGMLGLFASISEPIPTHPSLTSELPRKEIWMRAIWTIQDFPITGLGLDSFRKMAAQLYPFYSLLPDRDIASAHNLFLQSAVDLGMPALIAYGAIWFAVFRMVFLVARNSSSSFLRNSALGIGAGLAGHFVYELADSFPLGAKLGTFWWLDIALVTALFVHEFGNSPRATGRSLAFLAGYWTVFSVVSIALLSRFPALALLAAIAGSLVVGFSLVREPAADGTARFRGPGAELFPRTSRLVPVLGVVLCILALPGLARAMERNVLFVRSLRQPETMAASGPEKSGSLERLRAIGNAHWRLGNNSEAASFFARSLPRDHARTMTVFKSVLAHLRAAQPAEAQAVLRRHGLPVEYLGAFASSAHLAGNQVDAILVADLILNSSQPDANSLCTAATIYRSAGLLSSTVRNRIVKYAANLDPTGLDECAYQLGLVTFEEGDLELALSFWEPILQRDPDDQVYGTRAKGCYITYRLGLFHEKKRNPEAVRYYREAGKKWCTGVATWYAREVTARSPTG